MVTELILQEDRAWSFELLKELFNEEEVRLISFISLSFRWAPDKVMWHYDKRLVSSKKCI